MTARPFARAVVLGLVAIGAVVPAEARPIIDAKQLVAIQELVRAQMTEKDLPSVAVALAWRGRIVMAEGFGWADKEKRIPATPDTMYRIASVTKPLTATGLMRLVEAGKVDLDAPVDTYLGPYRLTVRAGSARDATVRRIANHTAGIPQHWQFFFEGRDGPAPTAEQTILHYGTIARPPGAAFEYTNTGYGALGVVVSRVSGLPFADYMARNVFAPLGMTHTAIEPGVAQLPYLAAAYDQKGRRLSDFRTDYPGGAGAFSSARDLIRFALFHLGRRGSDRSAILRDATLRQMRAPTATIDVNRAYGIGWRFDTVRGTAEHGGYYPGASAVIRLVPGQDAAVVVLTNISNDDQAVAVNRIADAALAAVIPGWGPAAPRATPPAAPPFAGRQELTGKWTGALSTYVGDMPITLEFLPSGEFARAKLTGQPATTLHNIRFDEATGILAGDMHGVLNTPDAARSQPYLLHFELVPREGVMTGTVMTRYFLDPNGPRLTHWISLRKQ